jgi:TolB-like protein/DNA-binding winged helix-turn-helix (wHTH) protein/Tfp pilus assembly protein PilF
MEPHDPTPLAFDDVAIDFAGHRLLRAGIEQPLEPKAFGVLALLAGTPGRVFARDEILDAVWGHRHVTPGVLNRVMTLLRHALGEDAQGAHYLHTVHGVGYRFDLPEAARAASANAAPGLVPEADSAMPAEPSPRRRAHDRPSRFARFALWSLPFLAALAIAAWTWWPHAKPAPIVAATPATPALDRSIAVLPLANASRDPDQQFFSDGLSDNLIGALSRFEGLRVVGRMSSFQLRDSKDDSKTLGAKLGVAYLLNGSVQRSGDVVRINTSLTKAADGSTLWAEHYDRPYKDLFAVQDEIARAIATALHAKLLSTEAAAHQSERPPSGNMAAYDAYLRGMQAFHRGDVRKVAEYLQEATRLDPGYAPAWAYLAVARTLIGEGEDPGSAAAKNAFAEAHAAADTALRLAPDLGAAHGALGNLVFTDAIDWQGALAELRLGARLAPNSGPNQGGLSRILASMGQLRDAIAYRERFMAIEPLVAGNYFLHAQLMAGAGRLDEAEQDLNIEQELAPQPYPSFQFMYIAILRGNANAALQIADAQPAPWREMNIALAAQLGPDRAAADAVLAKVIENGTWKKTSPYVVAQAYALRGDADKTVEWLERAWAIRDTNIRQLLYDPLILRFRKEPRLIAFCAKIGLPPPGESQALSIDQIRAQLTTKR